MAALFAEESGRLPLLAALLACGATVRCLCRSAYGRGWAQTLSSALSVRLPACT